MCICQVRVITTRKTLESYCLNKIQGPFPSVSHWLIYELLGPVIRSC